MLGVRETLLPLMMHGHLRPFLLGKVLVMNMIAEGNPTRAKKAFIETVAEVRMLCWPVPFVVGILRSIPRRHRSPSLDIVKLFVKHLQDELHFRGTVKATREVYDYALLDYQHILKAKPWANMYDYDQL